MTNLEKWIAMGICGFVGVVAGWGSNHRKMRKLAEKVDMTLEGLERATKEDIQEAILEEAVRNAAEHKVEKWARISAAQIQADMKKDISDRVKKEVAAAEGLVTKQVAETIAAQVAKIDEDALRKEVTKEAKQLIVDKFDDKLDGLLEDFNQNLSNVSKIYSSIASTVSKNGGGKEMVFRIGE